jgi:hypothetical protein
MKLLEKLKSKRHAEELSAHDAYLKLVYDFNDEADVDEVAAVLDRAGRTPDELERHVADRIRIEDLKATARARNDRLRGHEEEHRALNAERRAADQAKAKIDAKVDEVWSRTNTAKELADESEKAGRELLRLCKEQPDLPAMFDLNAFAEEHRQLDRAWMQEKNPGVDLDAPPLPPNPMGSTPDHGHRSPS